jgi:hypothetical protein
VAISFIRPDLDPKLFGHFFQLHGILDLVVLDMTIDHFPEEVQHAHAVVCVGCAAARHHAPEIPGLDRVNRRSADADLGVGIFGVQPARTHCTVLAAC